VSSQPSRADLTPSAGGGGDLTRPLKGNHAMMDTNATTWRPMGRTRRERQCEARLIAAGWQRASEQHYCKIIGDRELAIDQHIGHFCVGVYRDDRALGDTEKYERLEDAYAAALRLEARLST
jgi:hypothetical protein